MQHIRFSRLFFFAAALGLTLLPSLSFAQQGVTGLAHPWQLNFIEGATTVKDRLNHVHDILLYIITAICIFVMLVMGFIILRYNRHVNKTPATFTHNYAVEAGAILGSIVILAYIAWISIPLHYFIDREIEADMTLKVTGHQWYWSYEYPDQGNISFDSNMLSDADAVKRGAPRLLEVDNRVIVPVDTNVRVLITAADVIHSWAVPSFGVKKDAVPGRLNETWFRAEKEGVFYGQCSELCGIRHGFMPIAVEVVSKEKFAAWVKSHQKTAQIEATKPTKVATISQ